MDDTRDGTAEQVAWEALACEVREKLAERLGDLGDMDPDDIKVFVQACHNALLFHVDAASFDAFVTRMSNKFFCDD